MYASFAIAYHSLYLVIVLLEKLFDDGNRKIPYATVNEIKRGNCFK